VNTDKDWLLKMAALEDGCDVRAGSLEGVLERMSAEDQYDANIEVMRKAISKVKFPDGVTIHQKMSVKDFKEKYPEMEIEGNS